MRILQVSTTDIAGGAERVAYNLFQGYRSQGHESWLAVGQKRGDDPDVFIIPNEKLRYQGIWSGFWHGIDVGLRPIHYRVRGTSRLSQTAQKLAEPVRTLQHWRGIEDFHFPGTRQLLNLPPHPPQILHCHNLHGGYFDLRELANFNIPVIFTLHDAWLLSGHCSHAFACDRWKIGCGDCPDLSIYPAVRRDATAHNWERKKAIYASRRLYISTPCQWLMDKVQQSILTVGIVETSVIPYGVDLDIFKPADKAEARHHLSLPQDANLLLFSAASIRKNQFKDYAAMREAVRRVGESGRQVIFIALGEDAPPERISESAEIRFVPYQSDLVSIARFYQAVDVYLHAARVDTFPNAVLEALACGTPVIGSAVGGIPEQVRNLETAENPSGILVRDAADMANAVIRLLDDAALCQRLGDYAAQDAHQRFDLQTQIQTHLDWYEAVLAREKHLL